MQDGIIKGVGNSRFLKSVPAFLTLYPTYEAFAEALIAGTLPVDLNGINEAGWTQLGTALNKANLLSDETEVFLFGAGENRSVNEAFYALGGKIQLIMSNVAAITLTLKDSAGKPIPGVLVQGVFDGSGNSVYSDNSGVVAGYVSEGSPTLKVSGYADIVDYSEEISVTKGTTFTKAVTLTTRNYLDMMSSRSVKFSGNVETVDVALGGGGASGDAYYAANYTIGRGGGMGAVSKQMGIQVTPNQAYPAVVGAGGTPVANSYGSANPSAGNPGGSSSFLGVTATGGAISVGGRSGSVSGGASGQASNGTDSLFSSFTETFVFGGAGAGGAIRTNDTSVYGGQLAGAPGGGNAKDSGPAPAATSGLGGGGAAGSAFVISPNSYYASGKGGSGRVTIRMHLKSAT